MIDPLSLFIIITRTCMFWRNKELEKERMRLCRIATDDIRDANEKISNELDASWDAGPTENVAPVDPVGGTYTLKEALIDGGAFFDAHHLYTFVNLPGGWPHPSHFERLHYLGFKRKEKVDQGEGKFHFKNDQGKCNLFKQAEIEEIRNGDPKWAKTRVYRQRRKETWRRLGSNVQAGA